MGGSSNRGGLFVFSGHRKLLEQPVYSDKKISEAHRPLLALPVEISTVQPGVLIFFIFSLKTLSDQICHPERSGNFSMGHLLCIFCQNVHFKVYRVAFP